MQVANSIHELIGNTPMLSVPAPDLPADTRIVAKLEFFNPGGSIKDRIGEALIASAEASGKLQPGGTIIEPTAGNTGIGVALAAVGRGYRVLFCVPEKFSLEKQQLMRALGAEIVHTPTEFGMAGAIARAHELAREIPGSFVPQQFANPANPEAHYRTTGPEIWRQLDGRVDVFVAGAGTGGTFTGAARYLKEHNRRLHAVIVEPEGSVLKGGTPGSHDTEGIGVEFIPETLDMALVDEIVTVPDERAFATVHWLAKAHGVLAGSSSGAAYWAAVQVARRRPAGQVIAVIFPDSAERYLSKGIFAYPTNQEAF